MNINSETFFFSFSLILQSHKQNQLTNLRFIYVMA